MARSSCSALYGEESAGPSTLGQSAFRQQCGSSGSIAGGGASVKGFGLQLRAVGARPFMTHCVDGDELAAKRRPLVPPWRV